MAVITQQDQRLLSESKICLLGFGAQGEAEAFNLRRSEVPFTLGLRAQGPSADKAKSMGIAFTTIEKAIDLGRTIVMNLSDHCQKEVYETFPAFRKAERLVFAHGFNTHFKLIPVENDGPRHLLVAPKGAASGLKEFYGTSNALPALLAAQPLQSTADREWAEAFARAIGCHSKALIWADFKDETECDLFSEQVLLCGGVSSLLRSSYEVLLENGYHPEAAYFETLYELKLIVDLIWREGITGMRKRISPTARYGDITRGDRVIGAEVKTKMTEVLKEIQSGKFAKEFLAERESDSYLALAKKQAEHPLEMTGDKLRKLLRL